MKAIRLNESKYLKVKDTYTDLKHDTIVRNIRNMDDDETECRVESIKG